MSQHYPPLPKKYNAESLRRWLKSLPADSIVGYAGTPKACPVANWLSSAMDKPVKVDYEDIVVDGIVGYETPDWIERFEKKVDKQRDGDIIRRRQALNLLTRAEKATEPDW